MNVPGSTVAGPAWAIVLNGGYGVGKSTTLEHVGDLLAQAGRPFGLMNVDWFHRCWPPAPDDPDNVHTEAANLAAVWAGYRRAGPRQPVLSGVLTDDADRRRYAAALELPVRSVRLVADASVAAERLTRRYDPDRQEALHWHLQRHETLARRLAESDLDEHVIATDALSPREAAHRVLAHFGLS